MQEDIDKRVEQYILLRDTLKRIDDDHQKKRSALVNLQEKVAGRIREFMETNNITDGLKTAKGTCYLSTRYTASVQDGSAFMDFVKAGNWDLIERRANATAVQDFVKLNGNIPPGVKLTGIQTLGVRRPGKNKD